MASQKLVHRAVAAGISVGACMALPMVAYGATAPLDSFQDAVASSALPFAMGAAAGIGLFAITETVLDRDAAREDVAWGQDTVASAPEPAVENAEAPTHVGKHRAPLFKRAEMPADVPVIARAQDALSEEEAWADIDSMLTDDSPVSCDPATSKDIYQLAFEELARAASAPTASASPQVTASVPVEAQMPTAPRPEASRPVSASAPDATSVFLAAAVARMAQQGAAGNEDAAAAQAALDSLGGPARPMGKRYRDEAPAQVTSRIPAASQAPVASQPAAAGVAAQPTSQAAAVAGAAQPAPASAPAAQPVSQAVSAPVPHPADPWARYAGHESMWASALQIMDEPAAPARISQPVAPAASSVAATTPAASSPTALRPDRSAVSSYAAPVTAAQIKHARAVADGTFDAELHGRVNKIMDEELARLQSLGTSRRSSRDFLRVIQGGTISMPALTAEG